MRRKAASSDSESESYSSSDYTSSTASGDGFTGSINRLLFSIPCQDPIGALPLGPSLSGKDGTCLARVHEQTAVQARVPRGKWLVNGGVHSDMSELRMLRTWVKSRRLGLSEPSLEAGSPG